MIGERKTYNNITNIAFSISLIVLTIGLILFLIENRYVDKLKIIIMAALFSLSIIAIVIFAIISKNDTISSEFSKAIKIASIILISVGFFLVILSIILLRERSATLEYNFSMQAKLCYLSGALGVLGVCIASLCNNTHKVSIIALPSVISVISIIICALIT